MGGAKGWRWRAGLCHAQKPEVGGRESEETNVPAPAPTSSDFRTCPSVSAAIVSLLRRDRVYPLRRCKRILSVTRRTPEAVPDLADPDPVCAPAQYGAQGLQLAVIEEQVAAPRPRRRLDDPLAQIKIHVSARQPGEGAQSPVM